jgi:hypothetical protein
VSNTSNSISYVGSTGGHHSLMPTSAAQFRTADTDRRGWRQSSSRIDFAPPMCALPHSTPYAGGPISRFSGASPEEPKTEPERRQVFCGLATARPQAAPAPARCPHRQDARADRARDQADGGRERSPIGICRHAAQSCRAVGSGSRGIGRESGARYHRRVAIEDDATGRAAGLVRTFPSSLRSYGLRSTRT